MRARPAGGRYTPRMRRPGPRLDRVDLRVALAAPGVALALLGLGAARAFDVPFGGVTLEVLVPAALTAYFAILVLSVSFERLIPSFREAGGLLEDAVRRLRLTPTWALALALTSAVGEEIFFRGAVLGLLSRALPPVAAVLAQAVLFAALHPAPRRAWAYPLWTLCAGVILGAVALATGSVWPGVLAHYLFNHQNFNEVLDAERGRAKPA